MLSRQWWLDKVHVRGNNFVRTNKIWFYIRMEVQFWISTRVILWQCFQWNVFRRKICRIMYSMNDVIAVMVSCLHCITVVIGIRMMLLWKCLTEWLIDFSASYSYFNGIRGQKYWYYIDDIHLMLKEYVPLGYIVFSIIIVRTWWVSLLVWFDGNDEDGWFWCTNNVLWWRPY